MAYLAIFALWRHLAFNNAFDEIYILISTCLFATTLGLETIILFFRNIKIGHAKVQADIVGINEIIKINIILPRLWKVRAGQYINLCIPRVGFWGFLQTHPLAIASWTEGENPEISCLVQPSSGFTRALFAWAHQPRIDNAMKGDFKFAWFTGPHGCSPNLSDYGSVVMIATGFGIVAQLSYVKDLIRGYNKGEVQTRRMHLIWQLEHWGKKCSFSYEAY